jgi:translation elongation factor EF-G
VLGVADAAAQGDDGLQRRAGALRLVVQEQGVRVPSATKTTPPSPLDKPKIKGVDLKTDEEIEIEPSDKAHLSALAFKVATDPFVGSLTFLRIYSGTLKAGSYAYNSVTDRRERVGRVLQMHANKREELEDAFAGDIVAVVGLKGARTGHTLCEENHPVRLESMHFPEPVISVAIEPGRPDQEKMGLALEVVGGETRRSGCAPTPKRARRSSPAGRAAPPRSSSTA